MPRRLEFDFRFKPSLTGHLLNLSRNIDLDKTCRA